MPGLSLAGEIAGIVSEMGIIPALAVVVVCMYFIVREMKKQSESLEKGLTTLREHSDAQDEKIAATLSGFKEELQYIQKNYVTKEQHYSDFEGWRAEIKDLRDLITQFLIAGGFKNGKN